MTRYSQERRRPHHDTPGDRLEEAYLLYQYQWFRESYAILQEIADNLRHTHPGYKEDIYNNVTNKETFEKAEKEYDVTP
jgi:hypothetical protein